MEDIKFSDLANFQPKQLEAQKAAEDYKYLLYGGAAGGGKSYWLRWMGIRLLMYFYAKYDLKGIRGGLFCEDYPALRERHISKIPYEFPEWLGTLNKSEHEFRLRDEFGGGVLAFRNLDDPSKYLSSEFAFIEVDELTKNLRETFDFLNLRLRWPGIPDTKFLAASNPGEVGHGWVKKLWVTRDFSGETFNENDFKFIQSFFKDNKYIESSYELQLNSLPEQLRRAYKDGDWDIFAGQFFTEFRQASHVCEPFMIPEHWERFIGLDYGYTAPSAAIWCAYDSSFDTIYVYQELYKTGLTYEDLANEINVMRKGANIVYADPSIWAKRDQPKSGADIMMAKLQMQLDRANNNRIVGANLLRERLKINSQGQTKIKIFNTCKDLIRTLPELVHDDRNPEDVDTKGEDHAYDGLRYAVATYLERPFKAQKRFTQRAPQLYRDPLKELKF